MRWLIALFFVYFSEATLPKPSNFFAKQTTWTRRDIGPTALLSWDKPSDETLQDIMEYTVSYYPTKTPDLAKKATINRKNTTALLPGLEFFTPYTFLLAAVDRSNVPGFEAKSNFTTGEGPPSKPPQNVEVETVDSEHVKVSWTPAPQEFLRGILRGYMIKLFDKKSLVNTLFDINRANQLFGIIKVENITTDERYEVSVASFTVAAGEYSEPIPVKRTVVEKEDSSLVIIMCCAIIIPLVLIGLFIAFYILVLRPAFLAGKECVDDEIPDVDKSDVKLTDLTAVEVVTTTTVKSSNGDSGIVSDEKNNKSPI